VAVHWLILSRDPSGHALIAWLRRHRTSVYVINNTPDSPVVSFMV